MFAGAALITLIGLSVKHKDLANDGKPVHVG
jgi:hypothetical protein